MDTYTFTCQGTEYTVKRLAADTFRGFPEGTFRGFPEGGNISPHGLSDFGYVSAACLEILRLAERCGNLDAENRDKLGEIVDLQAEVETLRQRLQEECRRSGGETAKWVDLQAEIRLLRRERHLLLALEQGKARLTEQVLHGRPEPGDIAFVKQTQEQIRRLHVEAAGGIERPEGVPCACLLCSPKRDLKPAGGPATTGLAAALGYPQPGRLGPGAEDDFRRAYFQANALGMRADGTLIRPEEALKRSEPLPPDAQEGAAAVFGSGLTAPSERTAERRAVIRFVEGVARDEFQAGRSATAEFVDGMAESIRSGEHAVKASVEAEVLGGERSATAMVAPAGALRERPVPVSVGPKPWYEGMTHAEAQAAFTSALEGETDRAILEATLGERDAVLRFLEGFKQALYDGGDAHGFEVCSQLEYHIRQGEHVQAGAPGKNRDTQSDLDSRP